jgi:hypothetical protein
MERGVLDYFALSLLVIISITMLYAIIGIHDIPYNIARKRNHPHQDAIHTAGWVSLFLMHAIWPFLWIWATMYRPDRGWGMLGPEDHETVKEALEAKAARQVSVNEQDISALKEEITTLKQDIRELRATADKAGAADEASQQNTMEG